jgi:two-component system chemotaxis response regulator CheB
VVAVLLSGRLYDGTADLLAVKMHGGTAVVQDPAEAEYPGLCLMAARYVDVDCTLTLSEMAHFLDRVARRSVAKDFVRVAPAVTEMDVSRSSRTP